MFSTSLLPQSKNIAILESSEAKNSDIRSVIHKNFPKALEQTKDFAQQFKSDSAKETAFKVWKFLRSNIIYTRDSDGNQLIRLPSRFVNDGTGDCKSYSLLAASTLANAGLPVSFRYASYTSSPIPTHVYTVTSDEHGREIIVDGVYHKFNSEKKPNLKFDEPMKVYTLSGIGRTDEFLTGIGRRKRRGGFFKKLWNLNKKLALAPLRQSFLTLVAVNMFGLARKLARVAVRNPNGLKSKWEKMGGKPSQLQKWINKGLKFVPKKKRDVKQVKITGIGAIEAVMNDRIAVGMFGVAAVEYAACCGIGAAPLAALIAAAGTILAAISPLLKKHGKEPLPGEPNTPVTDENGNPVPESKTTVEKVLDVASNAAKTFGAPTEPADVMVEKGTADPEKNKDDTPKMGMNLKPVILIGGGLLVSAIAYNALKPKQKAN